MTTSRPSPWPQARLADHATVKARLGWKGLKAEEYVDDGFIFLASPNLKGSAIDFANVNHITEWRYRESPEIQLQVGDVLLVKDGSTLGIAGLVTDLPAPATVNGSIAVIRPRQSLDSGFLYYQVCGEEFQRRIRLGRSGLGVPHLFQADLREFPVSIPPLSDQRRIAEILTTVDEAIEQTEALIAKTQQIKTGLMHDLFTRGVTPDGHLRPPRDQAPELYKQSPLGWIPREWGVGLFVEYLDPGSGVKPGPFGSSITKDTYTASGFRVYGQEQVISGSLAMGGYYISSEKFAELRAFEVTEGDVLLSLVGTIGRVLIVEAPFERGIINPRLLRLRPRESCASSRFIGALLTTVAITRQIKSLAGGGTMPVINGSVVRALRSPLIGRAEQDRIVDGERSAEQRIANLEEESEKLLKLKTGLLTNLMTGLHRHVPVQSTGGKPRERG